jgi:Restriction endonuclease
MRLDQFRECLQALGPSEFEMFVADVIRKSGRFNGVKLLGRSGMLQRGIDIEAMEANPLLGQPRRWLFQAKKSKMVGVDVAHYMQSVATVEKSETPATQIVLVVSGNITNHAQDLLSRQGIEAWDAVKLAELATPELLTEWFGAKLESVQPDSVTTDKAAAFRTALYAMAPGQETWSAYQRLVSDILEFLFCPPLESPRYEFFDAEVRNRRDILFENPARDGFWGQVRSDYSAHYLVVDAKNYAEPIPKSAVLDIAHYLKPYGCGMFAVLVSRLGPDGGASHATREQWIGGRKMIVHLTDKNLCDMLELRASSGEPQEVIRRQIADFRMSL